MGSEFQRSTAENACAPDRPVSARCLRSPWEHRNSPRTLQASVSSGSPIAKQLHIPSAWLASEEEATPVPVTPSLQYNSHEETPPRTNSPYAAADDPYYAVSPILFPHGINSESAEDRPASPGGYSKARRRQVLGNKSRFQGEGIPTASPVSFSGSPVNARCAWKQGRGTFRPSLGSLRDGQLRITGWAKGPLTSGESCSDQLIEAFGCDELLPKPNFSMAREMLGHQSPQGSPSSVGSLPIEYDEEEYGFDRDIDYSQFDHLVALMPPAQFTIPKPSLATPEAAVFYEQHQELDPCRQSSGELEGTRAPDKGDDRKRWPDHTQRRLFVSRSPRWARLPSPSFPPLLSLCIVLHARMTQQMRSQGGGGVQEEEPSLFTPWECQTSASAFHAAVAPCEDTGGARALLGSAASGVQRRRRRLWMRDSGSGDTAREQNPLSARRPRRGRPRAQCLPPADAPRIPEALRRHAVQSRRAPRRPPAFSLAP
mmetsp:Transcript_13134/g.31118  ORF Transcript_13134/g.31118 Transcript_13134/m.31118 type:complete len:485 (+) Transcript_13134:587-2041(+)